MATKRTPLRRRQRPQIKSQAMLDKAARLLDLMDAHTAALLDVKPETMAFYTDGRHHELVALLPEVTIGLGIEPWEDAREVLAQLVANATSAEAVRQE